MKLLGLNISKADNNKGVNNAPVAKNDYADSVAGRLAARYGGQVTANGRAVGTTYNKETIQEIYQGYIFAAIKKISNQVADILDDRIETFNPKDKNADKPALDVRHPYLEAVDNGTMDNSLFWRGIATYVIVLGEAFVNAGPRTMQAGNIKPSGAFDLLQSNEVVRTYNDKGDLVSYKWKRKLPSGVDDETLYNPTDVIAITDLNPWDLRKGYGMIQPIVDKVSLENMTTKLQIATLANMLKAPGAVSSKEKLDDDDFDELKHSVETRWTSNNMEKAGTPIVSNGGTITYESFIEDLDKLAMQKIRNLNRDAFFAALSVSKTILGIEESGTTRDTSKTQREQFIQDACMPLAKSILSALNQDYINNYPAAYSGKPMKMRAVAPVDKDLDEEKTQAEINKSKAETFVMLVNSGLDPEQAAEVAGISLAEGKQIVFEARQVAPNTITLTDEQLKTITVGRNAAEAAPVTIENHNHSHTHGPEELAHVDLNKLTDSERKRLEKAENKLREQVRKLDTGFGEKYAQSLNQVSETEEQNYIKDMIEALLAYNLVSTAIHGKNRSKSVAKDFNLDAVPFELSDVVKENIENRLSKVANDHFKTIDKELSKVVIKATEEELPRREVQAAVRKKVSKDVATWQVERLVQTEASNAFNQSTFYADKQFIDANGFTGKAYKVWRTNSPKPCPFCTSQAGRQIPFEDNFFKVGEVAEGVQQTADGGTKQVFYKVGFEDVNAGGLHPNCHCDYQLVIEQ